jgi:hypothetical protein
MSGYGDVVIRGHDWADGYYQQIEVLQADPRILISGEFIDDVAIGTHPAVTLAGNVLTIRAANRTVIYRIVGHHPDRLNHPDTYIAEWPD